IVVIRLTPVVSRNPNTDAQELCDVTLSSLLKTVKLQLNIGGTCMNRQLLERPFSPEQIKRRQGTNGDVLDYIEGCAVIQRLNECFDAEWIFEVQEHQVYDDEVVVLGKLTAQGVSKSQFGKSRITRSRKDNSTISVGDDLKAAATDCLKKCATLFGIGLHLYFDAPQTRNGKVQDNGNAASHGNGQHHSGNQEGTSADTGRLTAKQLSAIFALA